MTTCPYALSINSSGTNDLEKMNPLTMCVFDDDQGVVTIQFLDMCSSSFSTAESIFGETLLNYNV